MYITLTPQSQTRAVEYYSNITSYKFNLANMANYPDNIVVRFFKDPDINENGYYELYPTIILKDGVIISFGDYRNQDEVTFTVEIPDDNKYYIYLKYTYTGDNDQQPASIVLTDEEQTTNEYLLLSIVENKEVTFIPQTLYDIYRNSLFSIRKDKDDSFSGTLFWDKDSGVPFKFDSDLDYTKWIAINDGSGNYTFKLNWSESNTYIRSGSGAAKIQLDGDWNDGIISFHTAKIGNAGDTIPAAIMRFDSSGTLTVDNIKINNHLYVGSAEEVGNISIFAQTTFNDFVTFADTVTFSKSVIFEGGLSIQGDDVSLNVSVPSLFTNTVTIASEEKDFYVYNNTSIKGRLYVGSDKIVGYDIDSDNTELTPVRDAILIHYLPTENGGISFARVWHSANDGPGSKLNADMVDGFHFTTLEDTPFVLDIGDGNTTQTDHRLVMVVESNQSQYYIPVSASGTSACTFCHSNCHSNCHADCGSWCH